MTILHFRDLVVWQRAMSLMIESYAVARCFPVAERFVLSEQLRRASLSVPANIAEGYGRGTRPEYIRFLGIANGSLKELETHLYAAVHLKYVTVGQASAALGLADEVGRMLNALRRRLKPHHPKP